MTQSIAQVQRLRNDGIQSVKFSNENPAGPHVLISQSTYMQSNHCALSVDTCMLPILTILTWMLPNIIGQI